MTALAIALGFLGLLAFVGFVLWLRARYRAPAATSSLEVTILNERAKESEARLTQLEEWKSNVNLAQGLRRKPEGRAS
jgi:hypothetical protein